jgi:uncharacterized delta-60 repeat protein
MKKLLAWMTALTAVWQLHDASASILDTTFNPGTGANGIVEQVLPMPDGRILICGNFTTFNGRNHPYIARLNNDGSLDESFFGQASYWVRHMALQSDGKIVIGGFFKGVQGVSRNLIARLNLDGSLDTSFNPGTGCTGSLGVAIDGNPDPFVMWTTVQPDGKILATGSFTNYNDVHSFGVVRINPDGSRDTSFNVGGGLDSWGRHIELLPNGQILLSGWFNNYNGKGCNRIARINNDGSPDFSFNPFFGDRTAVYSTALVANNKLVVCGHSLNYDGLFTREIKRINWDGSDDSSFVGYSNEKTESMVIQPDGNIIIGGYFNQVDGQVKTGVARMFADGTLDTSWGASIDNYVWTIALDGSGRLLVSGGFYTVDGVSRNGVARLLTGSSGTPPPPVSAAPTVSASAVSSSQINVSWTDSATDRSGYTLERKTGAGGTYATIVTLGSTARSFANGGLAAGTTYYFRLRATTTSGGAVYSNEAAATTSSATPPPPTGGSASASFVGTDTTTHGSWKGVYGSEGYAVFEDVASYPGYVRVTPVSKSDWTWQYSTSDARAVQKVNSATDRIAGCWYSGSGYSIDLAFTDGLKHRTSLYLLDWDNMGRVETVQVVDGDTGGLLYNQSLSGFGGGVYLTWDFGGHVKINITPNSGNAVASALFFGGGGSTGGGGGTTTQTAATPTISPNGGSYSGPVTITFADATAGAEIRYTLNGTDPTATSALYTGPFTLSGSTTVKAKGFKSGMLASATASAPFTISSGTTTGAGFVFVGTDSTRGGNWIGAYGSDGYYILPNFSKSPTYAQVSGVSKFDWTWNYSATDSRALQTPDGAGRTSGCWYNSGALSVDVRFTDGQTHRVAAYLCDWDNAGRSETVDLINADTGVVVQTQTVSGFSGGRYLVWDVKGHFQLRFTRTAGPNAVVNGLFFSAAARQL